MKNLGERSVRVPDRVKRGCTPPKTTIKRQKKCHIINIMKRLQCFTDEITLFHGLFVASKSLIFRTLHNNTIINKIVSHNINLMFHNLIFYINKTFAACNKIDF